ncbi:2-oxoisovalerate dehydrogenase E1 component [Lewinella marina]|uniref:Pyruvate dehydrogenase n=1 Tax=Neolewinella marina TaxID=438751 RepID=A0A2G0CC16_9BACT|nr:alpha-ketoacid dehydrogenase subunit alpha/beta [Neolewinella marina]NJB86672.1 2-oxoisovalerate dehydrogenase E1 component [Neolewinella marina]PHK97480.1 pyruvate dehydrogenase [Neolewinella marina]
MVHVSAKAVNSLYSKFFDRLRTAILIRRTEEKLLQLFAEGKLNGTVHTCVGQEFSPVMIAPYLQEDDFVVSNHRGHGHFIARTGDVKGLIAEVMGRSTGVSKGMGGSQHLTAHRYLSNGIQGGMVPVAAGVALSDKVLGNKNISVAFVGDGTLGEGIFYETMNLAGIWQLPLLIVVENNGYAQSTSFKQTFSGSLGQRVEGFGLQYFCGSTFDLDVLDETARVAVAAARSGSPVVLEIETYRLNSHSKSDDNRREAEVAEYRKNDPINRFAESYPDEFGDLVSAADAIIAAAAAEAEQDPIQEGCHPAWPRIPSVATEAWKPLSERSDARFNELIYESLKEQFETNDRTILIGEDIQDRTEFTEKNYGGAFKVTRDLSTLFPGRVRNTPISEAAITGIGTGLAVGGMQPIVEIMFGDFMTLTLDQLLQHAAKFHAMYGGRVNVPLILRTPMGGRRGYGPTHSQSLERFFLGIPGLNVVALNHRISPKTIYEALFQNGNSPTVVIENKILYTRSLNRSTPAGFLREMTQGDFPVYRMRPAGVAPQVTILCYGGMLEEAERAVEQAFDEHEILGEIICPTLLHPYDPAALITSVESSRKLVVVEEGTSFAGFGAEAIATVSAAATHQVAVKRLGFDGVIPCSLPGEIQLLPGAEAIVNAIKELVHGR